MKNKYDIIIIGSGIGGLVSAALLTNAGKRVLIIEKEPKPGGYLTEFKNENFVFDVSLHLLNSCGEGQYAYNIFRECGIINDIKFLMPKYLYRSIFPDFDLRVPQKDPNSHKELLSGLFPESQKGIAALFDEMSGIFHAVASAALSGSSTLSVLPYLRNSYEDVIKRHIKDERLKAIICQMWIYFGLPPSMLRAVDFCYPWYDYTANGGYYVEKGSYAIVKALVSHIRKKGGEFLFNKNIGRILVEDNFCNKVRFGRNEIFCDTLISNADLTKTVYELIGSREFPPASVRKLKTIEPSISAFEIFLGLNADLKTLYPDDYEIFVNSSYDIESQYRDLLHNNVKTAPFVITINSNVNRFSAPNGRSVVTIIMLSGYNYWISKSRDEYQDKKQKVADILIKRASKIIPEIASMIQKKVVSTPVTFERYTNNSDGAIYGYSRTLQEKAEIRPNNIKKIKNLYFASAWANQGSGVVKVLRSADEVCRKVLNGAKSRAMVL